MLGDVSSRVWSPATAAAANKAGRHWFKFIGCDFPQLATIVVNINGVDHNVSL